MLSGDAAEEEDESDCDSDRGDEDRGEGDEAELVIDIPNEWAGVGVRIYKGFTSVCVRGGGRGGCTWLTFEKKTSPGGLWLYLMSLLKQHLEKSVHLKREVPVMKLWQNDKLSNKFNGLIGSFVQQLHVLNT